jgi:hypothetical protein
LFSSVAVDTAVFFILYLFIIESQWLDLFPSMPI